MACSNLPKDVQLIIVNSRSKGSKITVLQCVDSSVELASQAETRLGKPHISHKEVSSFLHGSCKQGNKLIIF